MVFHKAVEMAESCVDVKNRVNTLIDCVTYSTFNYISRGLFERDKLTFTAQLAFQVCHLCISDSSIKSSIFDCVLPVLVAPNE